jgi:hypothetical protein
MQFTEAVARSAASGQAIEVVTQQSSEDDPF